MSSQVVPAAASSESDDILRFRVLDQESEWPKSVQRSLRLFQEYSVACTNHTNNHTNATAAAEDEIFETLAQDLAYFDYLSTHTNEIIASLTKEKETYAEREKQNGTSMQSTRNEIHQLKNNLSQVEELHLQHEEYEAYIKEIKQLPTRQEMLKQLSELQQEESALLASQVSLEHETQQRKKKYALFYHALLEIMDSNALEERAAQAKEKNRQLHIQTTNTLTELNEDELKANTAESDEAASMALEESATTNITATPTSTINSADIAPSPVESVPTTPAPTQTPSATTNSSDASSTSMAE